MYDQEFKYPFCGIIYQVGLEENLTHSLGKL